MVRGQDSGERHDNELDNSTLVGMFSFNKLVHCKPIVMGNYTVLSHTHKLVNSMSP